MPDPFIGQNAKKHERLEGLDWWYCREVDVPPEMAGRPAELVFDGIDCDCDVYLNGEAVASGMSAHLPVRAKVTKQLRPGSNTIAVRVDDGGRRVAGLDVSGYRGWFQDTRIFLRKPMYVRGWDWGPRLVSCGIYRPARIEFHSGATIRDLAATPNIVGKSATVDIQCEVELFGAKHAQGSIDLSLSLDGKPVAEAQKRVAFKRGRNVVNCKLKVARPKLWWPVGFGDATLYDLSADVIVGGELCDTAEKRVGIRSVRFEEEEIAPGETSFILAVNGERIFCKGANWAPPDSFPGRITPERTKTLVEMSRWANFNMLRIWGGGVYEPDLFFDMCDEAGIMVWMDFAFACSQVPGRDREFRKLVRSEVEHHARRLRSHPSLVVWCGNNEVQQMLDGYDLRDPDYTDHTRTIFDELIPSVLKDIDTSRPYRPSSPYGGDLASSSHSGDRHAWQCGIGNPADQNTRDWHVYDGERSKFVSEWGVMGVQNASAIRGALSKSGARPGSKEWLAHANWLDKGIVDRRIRDWVHPEPETLSLDDYVAAAQMLQSDGLEYGIERWRRRKWDCAGSLYWMLADCWPATSSWTTIDWDLRPKASHYAVRRAYAPIMVTLVESEGVMECWAVNDTMKPVNGTLEMGIMGTDGGAVASQKVKARVAANSSVKLCEMLMPSWLDRRVEFFHCRLVAKGKVVADNVRLLNWFRFVELEKAKIVSKVRHTKDGAVMKITSKNLALMVELARPDGVECDDNFFDLYPGKDVTVNLVGPESKINRVRAVAANRLQN